MRINSQSYRACIQDSLYTTVARFVTVGKVCTQLHVNLACSDELEPKPFAEIRMQIKSCRQYEIKKKEKAQPHFQRLHEERTRHLWEVFNHPGQNQ